MKIAILGDTHLGYARFEEDAFAQAEAAMSDAAEKAELILFAGDMFDAKIPKMETIARAIRMLKKPMERAVPVYAIHGNHERRTRDTLNPVQLMDSIGLLRYIHGSSKIFEKNCERVQICGIGSVPEEFAAAALQATMKGFRAEEGAFRIMLLHQTIGEMLRKEENGLSLEHLEQLPFDLVINGHHHARASKMGGRFLIPGSTVITQLKKEETEPKGYYLYDTGRKTTEFIPIKSRRFFYEELEFVDATESDLVQSIRETVSRRLGEFPDAIISIKLNGSLRQGLQCSDMIIGSHGNVFIDNRLNAESLAMKLDRIRELRTEKLSVRELALKELINKTEGRITLFSPAEIFERLASGSEQTIEHLLAGLATQTLNQGQDTGDNTNEQITASP